MKGEKHLAVDYRVEFLGDRSRAVLSRARHKDLVIVGDGLQGTAESKVANKCAVVGG